MQFIIKSNRQVNSTCLRAVTVAGFEMLRSYASRSLRLERICDWLSQATNPLQRTVSARAKDFVADIQPGHKPMSMVPSAAHDPSGLRTVSCLAGGYPTSGASIAIAGIRFS